MSDKYEIWYQMRKEHFNRKHKERSKKVDYHIACGICNNVNKNVISNGFKLFWTALREIEPSVEDYNKVTIERMEELLKDKDINEEISAWEVIEEMAESIVYKRKPKRSLIRMMVLIDVVIQVIKKGPCLIVPEVVRFTEEQSKEIDMERLVNEIKFDRFMKWMKVEYNAVKGNDMTKHWFNELMDREIGESHDSIIEEECQAKIRLMLNSIDFKETREKWNGITQEVGIRFMESENFLKTNNEMWYEKRIEANEEIAEIDQEEIERETEENIERIHVDEPFDLDRDISRVMNGLEERAERASESLVIGLMGLGCNVEQILREGVIKLYRENRWNQADVTKKILERHLKDLDERVESYKERTESRQSKGSVTSTETKVCYVCGMQGHINRNCPHVNKGCFKCGEKGHIARNCPTKVTCYNCGKTGHMVKECSEPRGIVCYGCGERGHMARECPGKKGLPKDSCQMCGNKEHTEVNCPLHKRCTVCEVIGHSDYDKDCPRRGEENTSEMSINYEDKKDSDKDNNEKKSNKDKEDNNRDESGEKDEAKDKNEEISSEETKGNEEFWDSITKIRKELRKHGYEFTVAQVAVVVNTVGREYLNEQEIWDEYEKVKYELKSIVEGKLKEVMERIKERKAEDDEENVGLSGEEDEDLEETEILSIEKDNEENNGSGKERKHAVMIETLELRDLEVSDEDIDTLLGYGYSTFTIMIIGVMEKYLEIKGIEEEFIKDEIDRVIREWERVLEDDDNEISDRELEETIDENKDEEFEYQEVPRDGFEESEDSENSKNEKDIKRTKVYSSSNSSKENLLIKDKEKEQKNKKKKKNKGLEIPEAEDFNLEELFKQPVINLAMAAQQAQLEHLFGVAGNGLNAPLAPGESIIDRLNTIRSESATVNWPTFSGKEEEDVNDWIRQFDLVFQVSGRPEGNVGAGVCRQNKALMAATCLRGLALQWYHEKKEVNAAHLVNWCDHDDDRNLKGALTRRFTSEDLRRRKVREWRNTKQTGTVGDYINRFMINMRIALRGHAMDETYKIDQFIDGLNGTVGYRVRVSNPATLTDAIAAAKREEEAQNELLRKTVVGQDIVVENKGKDWNENMQQINQTIRGDNVKPNQLYQDMQKPATQDDIDKIAQQLEAFRAEQMYRNQGMNNRVTNQWYQNQRRGNPLGQGYQNQVRNINGPVRQPMDWSRVQCFKCKQMGHTANRCDNFNWNRRPINMDNRGVNLMDNYYENEYEQGYDNNGYEEYNGYNDYNGYDGYYNDQEIYYQDRDYYEDVETYPADRVPRRSNRLNPLAGEQTVEVNEPEINDFRQQRPVEQSIPMKKDGTPYKSRVKKDGTTYYPGQQMRQGYDNWLAKKRAAGEPLRQSNIRGVKPQDNVDYESLMKIMSQQPEMIKKMMNKGKSQD
jgi:cellular nucleic acid-binding protein